MFTVHQDLGSQLFHRIVNLPPLLCFPASSHRTDKGLFFSLTLLLCAHVCSATQSCLPHCDTMDCILLDSSADGIFQPRILEQVAVSYGRGSSRAKDRMCISLLLLHWQDSSPLTPPGKPLFSFSWPFQKLALESCIIWSPAPVVLFFKNTFLTNWYEIYLSGNYRAILA